VTREDRELLAVLARLKRELAPLALRMMEGSASASEQQDYAQSVDVIIDGEVLSNGLLTRPEITAESCQES
jgi:hypothetical protein